MPSAEASPVRPLANPMLLITILLIVDSGHFIFAKLLLPHISPQVSAFYVITVGTVQMTIYGLCKRRLRLKTLVRYGWFFLGIGFLIGLSTLLNYESVAYIDPGTAALLARSTIFMSVGLGLFWLHEKLTRLQILGAGLAIIGVAIISFQPGDYFRFGALMIIASAFMYALHTAMVKRYGGEIEFVEFFAFRLMSTSAVLFVISAARGALAWPTPQAWMWLLLAGTIDVVISRSLFYLALMRMKLSIHSVVLTLTPAVVVLWSFLIFRDVPTLQQIIGGLGIIAGVMMVTIKQRL